MKEKVMDVLFDQLLLLSERSKDKKTSNEELHYISGEMDRIASTILNAISD